MKFAGVEDFFVGGTCLVGVEGNDEIEMMKDFLVRLFLSNEDNRRFSEKP